MELFAFTGDRKFFRMYDVGIDKVPTVGVDPNQGYTCILVNNDIMAIEARVTSNGIPLIGTPEQIQSGRYDPVMGVFVIPPGEEVIVYSGIFSDEIFAEVNYRAVGQVFGPFGWTGVAQLRLWSADRMQVLVRNFDQFL